MRQRKPFFAKWFPALAAVVLTITLAAGTGYGQKALGQGKVKTGIAEQAKILSKDHPRLRAALLAHQRHALKLMDVLGVVGTGVGIGPEGDPVLKVFTSRAGIQNIPEVLDDIPVMTKVTGRFYARENPAGRFPRPVPIGVSTGHPDITAGTIGARVKDQDGVYALSNNHVYAAVNSASLGDPALQPGPYDGGRVSGDVIGTLDAYVPLNFCSVFWIWLICQDVNTVDAAIARCTPETLGYATLSSDLDGNPGYGTPSETIYGDSNGDGYFDDKGSLLGLKVKKFGRTTGMTHGEISAIDATVNVCYDDTCSLIARFEDQIIISPGSFSGGGDSGSLIVTDDDENQPVALLFAGSDTETIANRIDLVLNSFGVTIDSGPQAALESIDVSGESDKVEIGRTVKFTATGTYDDGSTTEITTDVTWASSNTDVAIINSTGLATGIAEGTTNITATLNTITSSPVQLEVTESTIALQSITISPDNPSIEKGQTLRFTATGTYSDGSMEDITSSVQWLSLDENVATIDTTGLATGVSEGTVSITASFGDLSGETTLQVKEVGLHLEFGKTRATSAGLTRVSLEYDFGNEMVVVCAVNYDKSLPMPVVPHVLNASGKSFDVILVRAVGWDFETCIADVHWMVVKEGTYTVNDQGIKMEAGKFQSSRTDGIGSWVGDRIYPIQTYSHPVVLGQVMSLNSYDYTWDFELWSVFWARGSSYANPPNSSNIYIGKHSGQDYRVRATETLGYVIIEAGSGTIGNLNYKAGLTSDIIKGVGDKPPYRYSVSGISNPANAVAILSSAAMDGGDGGWPILYGTNPITSSGLNLAIDEDWAIDYERRHSTEQAGYMVLE